MRLRYRVEKEICIKDTRYEEILTPVIRVLLDNGWLLSDVMTSDYSFSVSAVHSVARGYELELRAELDELRLRFSVSGDDCSLAEKLLLQLDLGFHKTVEDVGCKRSDE